MDVAARWTEAGPLNTMTFAQRVPCQGADHAILAPATPGGQRLRRPGPLAAKTFGGASAFAAVRSAFRPRPPHRYLLVPRRWHRWRLPSRLRHRLCRRPPDPQPGRYYLARRRAAAAGPAPARGHRRHPHVALRP